MGNDFTNQPGQPPAPGAAPQPGLPPAPVGWPPQPAAAGWPPQAQAGWPPAPQAPGAWPPPAQPGYGQQPQPGWGTPPPGAYPPPPAGYAPYPGAAFVGVPRYGGFWIRLVAIIIDGFIIGLLTLLLAITVVGILLWLPLWFGYFPVLWWRRGATFGMQVLNLRVVRAVDGGPIDGTMAFIRALVFYAEHFFFWTFLIGALGFAWAAFEERKRAWHDMAAGTVVIQG